MVAFGNSVAAPIARAQFAETEPNTSKALANAFTGLVAGSTITGNSTGSSTATAGAISADYFRLTTAPAAPGIYQYRLTLTTTGVVGHTGTIRGLSQNNGVPTTGTDIASQASSATTTPARFNQWYGFGKSEQLYYRVTGTASTTADYVATLSSTLIAPTDIGSFAAGAITFDTVGRTGATQTDTGLIVLDSNYSAIPGYQNDDEILGVTTGSRLTRNYAPGVYYLALSSYRLENNEGAAVDDSSRSEFVVDFPNLVLNDDIKNNVNVGFAVTDTNGVTLKAATKAGAYDVNYYRFTVTASVPEPGDGVLLVLGLTMACGARVRHRSRRASATVSS